MSERAKRYELIASGSDATLRRLAERVASEAGFEVVRSPEVGMVMMRAVEQVEGIPFNLGEVLVTQAEVKVAGRLGWFMTMGRNLQRALDGAILDAAGEATLESWKEAERILAEEKEARDRDRRREWGRLLRTKVDFEVV